MNIPRGFTKNSGVAVPPGPHDRRADPEIGPDRVGQLALDTSHGFGRADDVNPFHDDPTTNWLLERMREHLEDIANRDSPANVFNVPDSVIIAAGGSGIITFNAIPLGSFWYVDRIIVQGEAAKLIGVYSSIPDGGSIAAGVGRIRDQATSDANGTTIFPTRGIFPLFFTGGEWLSIGCVGTAGAVVMANAQIRQFQK
jgi:hypothetical protein